MSTQEVNISSMSVSRSLKVVGMIGGAWAILMTVGAAMVIIQPP